MQPNLRILTEARTGVQIDCDACPDQRTVLASGLAGMACVRTLDKTAVPYRIAEIVSVSINGTRVEEVGLNASTYQGVGGAIGACESACAGKDRLERAKNALVTSLKNAGSVSVQEHL